MTTVAFDRVSAAINGTTVLHDATFEVADGEFIGVIGRSGSGKTSLLRTIAGFTDVTAGRVLLDGVDVADVAVADRDLAMAFQDPVVFPKRSVRRNISFPLELRRQHSVEIRNRVDAEVRSMHLEPLLSRPPATLTRGEAKLVQIARTLVRAPRVLLLDEPLAGLDMSLQASMRAELTLLQQGYGVTTVMATNEPLDALSMTSRLIVLDHGRVIQIGAPLDVRARPATVDAALATGDCSLLPADVERDIDGYWLVVPNRDHNPNLDFDLDDNTDLGPDRDFSHKPGPAMRHRAWHPSLADHVGKSLLLGIRPDDVHVDAHGDVAAIVVRPSAGPMGPARIEIGGHPLGMQGGVRLRVGESVWLRIERLTKFDPDTGRAVG